MRVECVRSTLLPEHILRNEIILIVRLRHHVFLVRSLVTECIIVLRMTLIDPANLEPVLIRFPLIVVALIKLGPIHLGLLIRNVVIRRTFIKSTLRIDKSLLPLIFVLVYAYIDPSCILTLILLVR